MVLLLSLLCACIAWQSESPLRAATIEEHVKFGRPYSALATPQSLQPNDVKRWGRIIEASPDQLTFMQAKYVDFAQRHNEYLAAAAKDYLSACELAGALEAEGWDSRGLVESMKAAVAEGKRVQAELERLELTYIDSIVVELSDVQLEKIYIFRNEASRRQSRSFEFFCPWSKVDLRAVCEEVSSGDASFAADAATMSRVLADYETQVTSLLRRAAEAHWDAVLEITELAAGVAAGSVKPDEFSRRYQSVRNRFGDAFERLRGVTERTIAEVQSLVSSETGEKFIARAKAAAFPEFYPDSSSHLEVFDRVIERGELDEGDLKAVRELRAGYAADYDRICFELEQLRIHWGDQQTRGVDGYQMQFMKGAIAPLLEKRTAISNQWLLALKERIGGAAVERHLNAIASGAHAMPSRD